MAASKQTGGENIIERKREKEELKSEVTRTKEVSAEKSMHNRQRKMDKKELKIFNYWGVYTLPLIPRLLQIMSKEVDRSSFVIEIQKEKYNIRFVSYYSDIYTLLYLFI